MITRDYSGTSVCGHLCKADTSSLQTAFLSPKHRPGLGHYLCNQDTSLIRTARPSPQSVRNREVSLYMNWHRMCTETMFFCAVQTSTPKNTRIQNNAQTQNGAQTQIQVNSAYHVPRYNVLFGYKVLFSFVPRTYVHYLRTYFRV